MNITDNFKNMLYEILDDTSVGDVQFGVLKTFYEEDVHKLYDELFCMLPDDKMQKLETVLQRVGTRLFLADLYRYRHVVKPFFKDTDDRECIEWAIWFDTNIHLNIYNKLQEYSVMEMKFDVTFQGIAQKNMDYEEFLTELYSFGERYGFKVAERGGPPLRFLNKYELEEINNG
jgi:hypothetical protein